MQRAQVTRKPFNLFARNNSKPAAENAELGCATIFAFMNVDKANIKTIYRKRIRYPLQVSIKDKLYFTMYM